MEDFVAGQSSSAGLNSIKFGNSTITPPAFSTFNKFFSLNVLQQIELGSVSLAERANIFNSPIPHNQALPNFVNAKGGR